MYLVKGIEFGKRDWGFFIVYKDLVKSTQSHKYCQFPFYNYYLISPRLAEFWHFSSQLKPYFQTNNSNNNNNKKTPSGFGGVKDGSTCNPLSSHMGLIPLLAYPVYFASHLQILFFVLSSIRIGKKKKRNENPLWKNIWVLMTGINTHQVIIRSSKTS